MPKPLVAVLLAASLVAGSAAGLTAADQPFVPDKSFSGNDQAKSLLAEGVQQYRAGRYKQAAAAFHSALKLEPDNSLLFQFYQAAGDGLLVRMEEHDELTDVLKDILRRAQIYQREMRYSPTYINLLMDKLSASEEERIVATIELIAVGPVAIPHLIARMNDNRQDEMRTNCRIVLTRMGYRAVVALNEALKTKDQRLVASIAGILADIGDARALPKLEQLLGDKDTDATAKRVIANTVEAIVKASKMSDTPAADGMYFTEALRYFRDNDQVHDEMVANESMMWRWDEKAEGDKKLSFVRVPRYAWNELMAEELLYDGMQAFPEFTAYFPLLAADLSAEAVDAVSRLRMAKESTVPEQFPDENVNAVEARVKALAEMGNRVKMFGGDHLYHAVQQSIVSERYDVAAYLMRILEDRWVSRADLSLPTPEEGLTPDKSGTVLCAALDHPNKVVRYQAAITLAHLDPALVFFNAQKVVPTLADAVGEWGTRVVMVVDQDYRQRNTAREQLHSKGYMVYTAVDGFEAMQRLEESPIKDAIIVAGDLLPTVQDEKGNLVDVPEQKAGSLIDKFKKDWRAEKTPVFISLPEDVDIALKIQKAFEGKVAGFIKKPFSADDINGKIEMALKDAQLPNVNREAAEDISLRAAIALQFPDPARTQFDLAQAGEALAKTLDARADALRIQTCRALGMAAQSPNGESVKGLISRVTDVYGAQDGVLKPEVRSAFLYAMGQLNPTTEPAVAILMKALQNEDAGVRAAASEAIGHGPGIGNEPLQHYLVQERMDIRGAGAGTDPLDARRAGTDGAAKPEAANAADTENK
jgi:CheY-like chemotaxis protein